MRAPKFLLICLFAVAAAIHLAGCATSFDQLDVAAVDDTTLTAGVKTALANEAGVGVTMNVNVAANNGTVQLTGFVDSEQTSLRAEQIARSVTGVRAVRNDLNVAPGRANLTEPQRRP
jgi:osmotically-inducible protein OsmY